MSAELMKYLNELIRRKTISVSSLEDKMLINYLSTIKIDADYFNNIFQNVVATTTKP